MALNLVIFTLFLLYSEIVHSSFGSSINWLLTEVNVVSLFTFVDDVSVSSLNTATESAKKNLAEAIQM